MDRKYLDYDGLVILVNGLKNGNIVTGATKAEGIVWGDYKIPLNNIPQGALERLYNVSGIKDAVDHSSTTGRILPGDTIRFNHSGDDILGGYSDGLMFVCIKSSTTSGTNIINSTYGFRSEDGRFYIDESTNQLTAVSNPIYMNIGDTIKIINDNGFDYDILLCNGATLSNGDEIYYKDHSSSYTADTNGYIVLVQSYNINKYPFGRYQINGGRSDLQYITVFNSNFVEFTAGAAQKAVEADAAHDVVSGSNLDRKLNDIKNHSTMAFDTVQTEVPQMYQQGTPLGSFDIVYNSTLDRFLATDGTLYYKSWSKYGMTQSDYNDTETSKQNILFSSAFGYVYNSNYYPSQDQSKPITESEITNLFN